MPQDVSDVMEIMASKKYDIQSIITDEFSINDLPKALEQAGKTYESLNVIINFDIQQTTPKKQSSGWLFLILLFKFNAVGIKLIDNGINDIHNFFTGKSFLRVRESYTCCD